MRLEMIGMQFDQAGHDQVAAGVRAACGRVALAISGDAAIRKSDPAAFDHAIRQNNPGVADNRFGPCRSHISRLPSCRGGKRYHVANSAGDRRRISSSWTMATMATPARIFSSIRSTTMARLTASRDAYAHPTPYTRRLKPRDAALFCPDGHLSALCDLSCSC